MNGRRCRQPERHMVDGREMTVPEIADMLGISRDALYNRRCEIGQGTSYQVIVDMYRANQFGNTRDRSARYMIEGRWMSRREIAGMLGISMSTLRNWMYANKGRSLADAVAWYRQYQTGERVRHHGQGGRKPVMYRAGRREYSVPQVARMFGVTDMSVRGALRRRGGDMAETIRHYKEREVLIKRKAEREIMNILGF